MKIAIFCSSTHKEKDLYTSKCLELIDELAKHQNQIIYGGSKSGLMGIIADRGLEHNLEVHGVITKDLSHKETEHKNLTSLVLTENMSQRKYKMYELSDAFIILPGGTGTMDEFFEIYTLCQLGYQRKAILIYNILGFYDKLLDFLDGMVENNFLDKRFKDMLIIEDNPKNVYELLENYKAPRAKWSEK